MLKRLEISDRKIVENYLSCHAPVASEFTFTNLLIWNHVRPVYIMEEAGSLVFLRELGEGFSVFGDPAGKIGIDEAMTAHVAQVCK